MASVTTIFIPYYLGKKYRREDTAVFNFRELNRISDFLKLSGYLFSWPFSVQVNE